MGSPGIRSELTARAATSPRPSDSGGSSRFSSPYTYAGGPRKLEERRWIRDHAIDAVLCIILTKVPTRNGPNHCGGIGCLGCFEKRSKRSVRQRHACDDYKISRRNELAILHRVTNCHPAESLTNYIGGQVCCGDFESTNQQRTEDSGCSPAT